MIVCRGAPAWASPGVRTIAQGATTGGRPYTVACETVRPLLLSTMSNIEPALDMPTLEQYKNILLTVKDRDKGDLHGGTHEAAGAGA